MKGKRTTRVHALALFVVAAVIAAGLGTASAIAAPQQTATFAVVGEFEAPGEFTSDGSLVCASGSTSDEFFPSGFQSGRGVVLHDRKTISCDDGSGTFTLLIQGRTGFNVGDGDVRPMGCAEWNGRLRQPRWAGDFHGLVHAHRCGAHRRHRGLRRLARASLSVRIQ